VFGKGLLHKNIHKWDKLDGKGCMDLFLKWNDKRK